MLDPDDKDKNWCIVILKYILFYWRGIVLIVWPFITALVFLIGFDRKIRCLYVIILMAGFWLTECMPLSVTGMIPMILLPMLGIQNTADVCINYFNKTNMIFIGSLLIAIGIEHCGLHRRIAYITIIGLGCSPRRLHFGLTVVTTLLSMWLINAATTAMMCPIIAAIITELESEGIGSMYKPRNPTDPEDEPPRPTSISTAYFLAAAYASTLGGIGSLVGTATNLTYKGIYETRFPNGNKIEFVPWLVFNFPPMILMCLVCWLTLEWVFMGLWRPNSEEAQIIKEGTIHKEAAYKVMKDKLAELGSITFNEVCVLVLFISCIFMWFFRRPQFIPGWGDLFNKQISDASPAIMIVFLYAALPASFAFFDFCKKDQTVRPTAVSTALVPWKVLQDKMPWGLVFLLGGGFAMAGASKASGLSTYLGEKLSVMSNLPSFVVLCLTSLIVSVATEFLSNVAVCNLVTPVLIEMSMAMKIHPNQFTLPSAVIASFCFMLPVGTPANAVVAEYANVLTTDMMKGGILLKIFSWLIYLILYPTYGRLFYDQGGMPDWLLKDNETTPSL